MSHVIVAAWEDEIVQCATAPFQPRTYCTMRRIHEFELNRTLGPLLYDDGAIPQTPARNQIADVMILVPVPSLDGGSRPGARWAGGQMLSHNLVEQQIADGHARHLWLCFPVNPDVRLDARSAGVGAGEA